jgi:hypothetical protein
MFETTVPTEQKEPSLARTWIHAALTTTLVVHVKARIVVHHNLRSINPILHHLCQECHHGVHQSRQLACLQQQIQKALAIQAVPPDTTCLPRLALRINLLSSSP